MFAFQDTVMRKAAALARSTDDLARRAFRSSFATLALDHEQITQLFDQLRLDYLYDADSSDVLEDAGQYTPGECHTVVRLFLCK
jgi:hypothetical protein